jgi:hypothetical protein
VPQPWLCLIVVVSVVKSVRFFLPVPSNLGEFPLSLLPPFVRAVARGSDRVKQTFLYFPACDINISLLLLAVRESIF